MTMRVYSSTDASAPTLQGVVGGAYSSGWADGSLLNLLDKVLVTGYGSKTAAGWTRSFTGTSKGVFKQGAGCGFHLRVLDDGSLTAGAREASFYGEETASDVDTGTGLFPTAAQQATGLKMRKSETADTVQRPWVLYADNKTFYLFVYTGNATAYLAGMCFGDFFSFKSGDAYNCIAIGRVTSAIADTLTNEALDLVNGGTTSTVIGHYVPRGYTQLGTAVNVEKRGTSFNMATASGAAAMGSYTGWSVFPNPEDSGFYIGRLYIIDNTTTPTRNLRGYLRGLWSPQVTADVTPFEYTFAGVGTIASRTFKILGLRTGNAAAGRYVIETSDTWD